VYEPDKEPVPLVGLSPGGKNLLTKAVGNPLGIVCLPPLFLAILILVVPLNSPRSTLQLYSYS